MQPRGGWGIFEEEFSAGGVGDDEGDLGGFVEKEAAARHFEIEVDLSEGGGSEQEEEEAWQEGSKGAWKSLHAGRVNPKRERLAIGRLFRKRDGRGVDWCGVGIFGGKGGRRLDGFFGDG